jgi:hypothetical protein
VKFIDNCSLPCALGALISWGLLSGGAVELISLLPHTTSDGHDWSPLTTSIAALWRPPCCYRPFRNMNDLVATARIGRSFFIAS